MNGQIAIIRQLFADHPPEPKPYIIQRLASSEEGEAIALKSEIEHQISLQHDWQGYLRWSFGILDIMADSPAGECISRSEKIVHVYGHYLEFLYRFHPSLREEPIDDSGGPIYILAPEAEDPPEEDSQG